MEKVVELLVACVIMLIIVLIIDLLLIVKVYELSLFVKEIVKTNVNVEIMKNDWDFIRPKVLRILLKRSDK